MSPEGGSGSLLSQIRKNKYAIPLGFGLAALLSVVLMIYAWWVCFSFLAIALILYGLPTLFGYKNKKWLAVFGTVMLVVLALTWTMMVYNQTINFSGETLASNNGALVDGTVDPVVGQPGTFYTFNVTVASGNTTADLHLYLTNDWETGESAITNTTMVFVENSTRGALYTRTIQLNDSGLFGFAFALHNSTSGVWVTTDLGYGPVNADNNAIFMKTLQSGLMIAFFQIGLLFYLLLLLVFWMDRSRKKMANEMKKRETTKTAASGEKFVCSECGSDVPIDAEKCPQCGERFDEPQKAVTGGEEKKCPKCNAVIFDTDKKCWNCGIELGEQPKT
jgi:ribosomal protein L40E